DGSGAKSGNRTSIGVEICESGDYTKTLDNAAGLVASMLKERGWGVDRLRRHFDWSGKICPQLMYDGGEWTGWAVFKALVQFKLNEEDEAMTAQEKKDFEAMQMLIKAQAEVTLGLSNRITELETAAKLPEIPKWALPSCEAAKAAGLLDTTANGSYDFYRMVTILHRAGAFKK
ncbi:peptidoglycan recognition protein family protein, partial [Paenibacillus albidus]|uniref:peptidoglycan recognition protein family protein n=1 Tax=Paenibacillus albidus TaxID=2041023 RepID=UPI00357104DE